VPNPRPRRVLFVLTSHGQMGDTGESTGYHAGETAGVWRPLRDAGVTIDFASPLGGEPPVTRRDPDDPQQNEFFSDPDVAAKLADTLYPEQVIADDYAAVVFLGGHGPMFDLRGHQGFEDIARDIYENDGLLVAICHGPAVLIDLRLSDGTYLISGKRLTSFPDAHDAARGHDAAMPFPLQASLEQRGALFSHAGDGEAYVVLDGRLITGQNPTSSEPLARHVLKLMDQ
jgi:putative intracellular protease/amidase